MRINTLVTVMILAIGISSCETPGPGDERGARSTEEKGTAETFAKDNTYDGEESSENTTRVKKDPVEEHLNELKKDPKFAKENNTTSAYKYLTTTKEYSIFGGLIQQSKLAKVLHNQSTTVLAPDNSQWDMDFATELKKLAKDGKVDELDSYLSQYVIESAIAAEKLDFEPERMNMDGSMLVFDHNETTVSGIAYDEEGVMTDNGIVVPLYGTFPRN